MSSPNVQPTCRLCGEEVKLVDSHILPEFFYQSLYDEGGRFKSISNHPHHRPRLLQKGFTERLLCEVCDGKLSRYETYSARLLRRADEATDANVHGAVLQDVNFRDFRLFGLSLLWRMHVSSLHMFRVVRLGVHAERLRRMLAADDPGQPHEYGFLIWKVAGLKMTGDMLVAPLRAKLKGHIAYQMTARGYRWVFTVSSTTYSLGGYLFVGAHAELPIPNIYEDQQSLFRKLQRAFPRDLGGSSA